MLYNRNLHLDADGAINCFVQCIDNIHWIFLRFLII